MPALRPKFWRELNAIIAKYNGLKVNGTVASQSTQAKRRESIHAGFNVLAKDFHCRLVSPTQFREKHMFKLVSHWETQGRADIQTQIGYFRTFGNVWLGKGGGNMIKASEKYASNPESVRRRYITNRDKTWTGNAIDIEATLATITTLDERVGIVTELCLAFGLRRTESALLHPHEDFNGHTLHISRGSKGGRERDIQIEHESQRELLKRAARFASPPNGSLIPEGKSLKAFKEHVKYVLRQAGVGRKLNGVTLHGLRHEYAVRFYEKRTGLPAPIKGASEKPDPQLEKRVKGELSEALGHSREPIVGCYIGSRHRPLTQPGSSEANQDPRRQDKSGVNEAEASIGQ